jgi:hypothetical protein
VKYCVNGHKVLLDKKALLLRGQGTPALRDAYLRATAGCRTSYFG